jgi:hypothetical protein
MPVTVGYEDDPTASDATMIMSGFVVVSFVLSKEMAVHPAAARAPTNESQQPSFRRSTEKKFDRLGHTCPF